MLPDVQAEPLRQVGVQGAKIGRHCHSADMTTALTAAEAFFGTEPTGQRIAWTIIYADTLREGKVVEHASGDGWLDLLINVGSLPPPG